MYETLLKVIITFIGKYYDVRLHRYSKIQILHTFMTFDNIKGVGKKRRLFPTETEDSFPTVQIR